MGGAHSQLKASITSPTSTPYLAKQLAALFHTQTPFSFLLYCIVVTNDILRILVYKAQPSTQSTGPRSPTRLGIRSQDLSLPDEYSHCGLSAACRHKVAFTRRVHALLTATDTTALHYTPFFLTRSKLTFKVPTTT